MGAQVRPRSHWEAIDLGFRLVRPHIRPMLSASCIVTLPLFAVVHLLLWDSTFWASLVMWWLKPLWERVHLHVLSRSLFGETPSVRETVYDFREYGFRQWLKWLTVRRLSATRSLDLPVTQLEHLDGRARTSRLAILRRGDAGSGAVWLMIVCAHMELFLVIGGVLLAQLFVPDSMHVNVVGWLFRTENESPYAAGLVGNLASLFASMLVAPFYVGGGFALYINRRTVLEGWDLEIAFRRIARRLKAPSGVRRSRQTAAAVALFVLIGEGLLLDLPVRAQAPQREAAGSATPADVRSPEREAARETIREVLAGEAFHQRDTIRVPKLVFDWRLEPGDPDRRPFLPEWLLRFFAFVVEWLARISEAAVIAVVAGVVAYSAYRYRNAIAELVRVRASPGSTYRPPTRLVGMDVTPASLPRDVVESVLALWHAGEKRAAVALLYRATLIELMRHHAVELHEGYTERDCLRATRTAVEPICARYFASLTRKWQLTAYAHRPPDGQEMRDLCTAWPEFFRSDGSDAESPHVV